MADPPRKRLVALTGNPNSGKTTLFNALTGGRQHVGNYPGVTVETKSGRATRGGRDIEIVDLPGTYSLTAHSDEEVVARNFILDRAPDVIIDVVDSSNLERHLYLAVQLLELGVPLLLAFNMSDVAEARGYSIDSGKLSGLLGAPIVHTVASKRTGVDELLDAADALAADRDDALTRQRRPGYGRELEPHVRDMTERVAAACPHQSHHRWTAIKLLEGDGETARRLRASCPERLEALLAQAGRLRGHIRQVCGDEAEVIFADRRYGFISGACMEAVTQTVESRHAHSDRIDAIVTNRILGLPLFLLMTFLVFQATFWLGNPLATRLTAGKELLAGHVLRMWPRGSESLVRSLLVDGIMEGVGAVVVFVPLVFLLFAAIAVLEDSGYMARAAYVMDRLMHKIGLHGKSFIPMLIGFGCTVPAVLATRTLESRRDRLTTMLVLPLFSCSARLPIYLLILGAFFPSRRLFHIFGVVDVTNQALWLMLIYLIGVAVAVLAAKALRKTIFRGEVTPFVMELPPYRLPTLHGVVIHSWERTWMFLRKAGTLILAAVVVLWATSTFPRPGPDSELARQAEEADAKLIAATARIGRDLGGDRRTFRRFADDELALRRAQAMHWPDSEGYRIEEREYIRRVADLKANDRVFARFHAALTEAGPFAAPAGDAARAMELAAAAGEYRLAAGERREAIASIDRIRAQRRLEHSAVGRVGRVIAPVMSPCGFDWKVSTSLVGAIAAKEIFVSQMSVMLSVGTDDNTSLREKLQASYTPLQGFCMMLFALLTMPCAATMVATWRESGGFRWAIGQVAGLTVIAWLATAAVYQIGSALGAAGN
jgi:ferrous iron transport protein B